LVWFGKLETKCKKPSLIKQYKVLLNAVFLTVLPKKTLHLVKPLLQIFKSISICMKICEVIPKTIKPLTPQQMMIRNLKQNIENSKKKLQAEKDRQRKVKDMERQKRIMNYG